MEYSSKGQIAKVRHILSRNLQEFKSPSVDWTSPANLFRFVDATSKSMDLIHLCIGEVNTLLTAQGLKEVSKVNNLVFETLVSQLSIALSNLSSQTISKTRPSGSVLAAPSPIPDSTAPKNPGENRSKICRFRNPENPQLTHATSKAGIQAPEGCACICHETLEQFKAKLSALRSEIVQFEDVKAGGPDPRQAEGHFLRLAGHGVVERETQKLFEEIQQGNMEALGKPHDPLVLLGVNQKVLNNMLEDHYQSRRDMEHLLSSIDSCDLQKSGPSPLETRLKSLLADNQEALRSPTPKFIQEIVAALNLDSLQDAYRDKIVAALKTLFAKYVQALKESNNRFNCHVGTSTTLLSADLKAKEAELERNLKAKEVEMNGLRDLLAQTVLQNRGLLKEEERNQFVTREIQATLEAERDRVWTALAEKEELQTRLDDTKRQLNPLKDFFHSELRLFKRYEPQIVDFHESMILNSLMLERRVRRGEPVPDELLTMLVAGKGSLLFNYRLLEGLSSLGFNGIEGFKVNFDHPLQDLDAEAIERMIAKVDETEKAWGNDPINGLDSDRTKAELIAGMLPRRGHVFKSEKVKKMHQNGSSRSPVFGGEEVGATPGGSWEGEESLASRPPKESQARTRGRNGERRTGQIPKESLENRELREAEEDEFMRAEESQGVKQGQPRISEGKRPLNSKNQAQISLKDGPSKPSKISLQVQGQKGQNSPELSQEPNLGGTRATMGQNKAKNDRESAKMNRVVKRDRESGVVDDDSSQDDGDSNAKGTKGVAKTRAKRNRNVPMDSPSDQDVTQLADLKKPSPKNADSKKVTAKARSRRSRGGSGEDDTQRDDEVSRVSGEEDSSDSGAKEGQTNSKSKRVSGENKRKQGAKAPDGSGDSEAEGSAGSETEEDTGRDTKSKRRLAKENANRAVNSRKMEREGTSDLEEAIAEDTGLNKRQKRRIRTASRGADDSESDSQDEVQGNAKNARQKARKSGTKRTRKSSRDRQEGVKEATSTHTRSSDEQEETEQGQGQERALTEIRNRDKTSARGRKEKKDAEKRRNRTHSPQSSASQSLEGSEESEESVEGQNQTGTHSQGKRPRRSTRSRVSRTTGRALAGVDNDEQSEQESGPEATRKSKRKTRKTRGGVISTSEKSGDWEEDQAQTEPETRRKKFIRRFNSTGKIEFVEVAPEAVKPRFVRRENAKGEVEYVKGGEETEGQPRYIRRVASDGREEYVEETEEPVFVQRVNSAGEIEFVAHTKTSSASLTENLGADTRKKRKVGTKEAGVSARPIRRSKGGCRLDADLGHPEGGPEGKPEGKPEGGPEGGPEVEWDLQRQGRILFQGKTEMFCLQRVLQMLSAQIQHTETANPRGQSSLPGVPDDFSAFFRSLDPAKQAALRALLEQGSKVIPAGLSDFLKRVSNNQRNNGAPDQAAPKRGAAKGGHSTLLQRMLRLSNKTDRDPPDKTLSETPIVERDSVGRQPPRRSKIDLFTEPTVVSNDNETHQSSRLTTLAHNASAFPEPDANPLCQMTPENPTKYRGGVIVRAKPNLILGSFSKAHPPFVPDIAQLGFCLQNQRIAQPSNFAAPVDQARVARTPSSPKNSLDELRAKINAITNPVVKKIHLIIYVEKLALNDLSAFPPQDPSHGKPSVFKEKMSEPTGATDALLDALKARLVEVYAASKLPVDWNVAYERGQKYILAFVKQHASCGSKCIHLDDFCLYLKMYLTKVVGGLPPTGHLIPPENFNVKNLAKLRR